MHAVATGGRCLLEGAAVAYDDASQTARSEAIRKRRTIAGAANSARHPEPPTANALNDRSARAIVVSSTPH